MVPARCLSGREPLVSAGQVAVAVLLALAPCSAGMVLGACSNGGSSPLVILLAADVAVVAVVVAAAVDVVFVVISLHPSRQ
jgi:hypothetical protein